MPMCVRASGQPVAAEAHQVSGRRPLGQLYLFNMRRVGSVVAVPCPDGNDPDVSDLWPRCSFPAIGILLEVRGHGRILCWVLYLLGHAFELHRLLIIPTDHERDSAIPREIRVLARRRNCVEDDLSLIRSGDSHQCRLGFSTLIRRRQYRQTTVPDKRHQGGTVHIGRVTMARPRWLVSFACRWLWVAERFERMIM